MHKIIQTYKWIPLLCIVLLASCEQSTDWELEIVENDQLVVEAILTDEFKRQEILLSQTYADLNGESQILEDALMRVKVEDEFFIFQRDEDNPLLYKSVEPFRVLKNLIYTLQINWGDNIYISKSTLSNVAPLPNFKFKSLENDQFTLADNFVPILNFNQQAMYEVNIDWSHLTNDTINTAKFYYYTFSDIHISQIIRPDREEVIFPKGSIAHIKKYGLNDNFASFLRAKVIETDWDGTFFYGDAANLPSNIPNGLGFFSTCAVLSDTSIVE